MGETTCRTSYPLFCAHLEQKIPTLRSFRSLRSLHRIEIGLCNRPCQKSPVRSREHFIKTPIGVENKPYYRQVLPNLGALLRRFSPSLDTKRADSCTRRPSEHMIHPAKRRAKLVPLRWRLKELDRPYSIQWNVSRHPFRSFRRANASFKT